MSLATIILVQVIWLELALLVGLGLGKIIGGSQ